MDIKYDQILNYLLDNWIIAVMVIVAGIIMALPQLRDGLNMLWPFSSKEKKELLA